MLIFKTNIYQTDTITFHAPREPGDDQANLHIQRFITNSLEDDLLFFSMMDNPAGSVNERDLAGYFPRSHRFGDAFSIRKFIEILQKGHIDTTTWFRMNTYHFCVLYDSILRHGYNYNHGSHAEKIRQCPEMNGKLIGVIKLIDRIFFNTVFLMEEEKYNLLTACDKSRMGFNCPCQFGVIYGLAPAPDELNLQAEPDFPYSIAI